MRRKRRRKRRTEGLGGKPLPSKSLICTFYYQCSPLLK